MFSKKKSPYEYITKDNFDMVRQCLTQGMYVKDPRTIVENILKFTNIPEEAAVAIVSNEIGPIFDAWKDKLGRQT